MSIAHLFAFTQLDFESSKLAKRLHCYTAILPDENGASYKTPIAPKKGFVALIKLLFV